jgi:hypothetical protein
MLEMRHLAASGTHQELSMANTKQPGGDTQSTGGQKSGQQSQGGSAERDTDADRKSGSGSNEGGNQQGSGTKSGQQSQGGSGNFADDPERASEAARKGGQASHGGSGK